MSKNKNVQDCSKNKKTSIGGQALIEGIMMRGPKRSAMAVRNPKGEIVLEEWDTHKKPVPKVLKLPIIRGVNGLITSMATGYKTLMRSAEIAMPEINGDEESEAAEAVVSDGSPDAATESVPAPAKKKKSPMMTIVMLIGTALGIALSIGLFIFLPSYIFNLLNGWLEIVTVPEKSGGFLSFLTANTAVDGAVTNVYLCRIIRSAFEGVLRILIFLIYILLVSLMKDIKRTFMYHGAEHKTIFCYENGLPLTVENVKMQRRLHPRCGTSFMIIMMLVGIIIGFFIPFDNSLLRSAVKLAILPITIGIGYEIIKFAGRHDNLFIRILSAPGLWMQKITTKEPDEPMIECAIKAFEAVLPPDGSDKI